MSKRNHSQVSSSSGDAVSKRRATAPTEDDETALLRTYANSLIECLRGSSMANPSQELRDICKSILPAIQQLAQSGPSQSSDGEVVNAQKQSTESSSPIPPFLLLPPFKVADIPESLPPLPPIRDPVLKATALTHAGASNKPSTNYDRLEWLGDAYSEVISSSLLYSTFGHLEAGKLSQLRELLIKNVTLGALAEKYGLVEEANLPADVRASTERMKKVPGDLMEAYAAAILLDDPVHGLQRLGEWLRAVFSITIKEQIKAHERKIQKSAPQTEGHGLTAKDRLRILIGGVPGVKIRYEDDPSGPKFDKHHKKLPVYSVNVFLDGWGEKNKMLGRGTDLGKKQAGQKAAQMALDSTSLMKKLSQKKMAYMEAQVGQ
ncbi:ribonuclease [Plectosphaerella plurivora]|uniref:Ribonuclease n=1 Tax=Plectosphaerella plurivora TaxID=936078 RepID=A0A9P8VKZ5_9PEZI|nr:ribonuclease [Plectosphaerella plurivora]